MDKKQQKPFTTSLLEKKKELTIRLVKILAEHKKKKKQEAEKTSLRDSPIAWNHSVKSFYNGFRLSGDATKSIKYALNELKNKYPDIKFDIDSFINPIVEHMKKDGLIEDDYIYRG